MISSAGLFHHSDRGVRNTALSFDKRLEEVDIVPSMGRARSAPDNAVSGSFVSTLECELVHRRRFPAREAAERSVIFEYLEAFYNRMRLHSSLGYMSLESHEETTREGVAAAAWRETVRRTVVMPVSSIRSFAWAG